MPIRLSTSLLLSTALSCVFVCGAKGNFCTECSVTIMDASALIHQECDAEKLFAVNPDSGVVHLKASSFYQPNFVNHYHGTHSGPWHFQKVIPPPSSTHRTEDSTRYFSLTFLQGEKGMLLLITNQLYTSLYSPHVDCPFACFSISVWGAPKLEMHPLLHGNWLQALFCLAFSHGQ